MHSGKRRGPHGWDVFLHVFTNPSCEEPRNEFTSYKYMCIYIIFEGVSRMLPNVETMIYHLPHRGRARGSKTF